MPNTRSYLVSKDLFLVKQDLANMTGIELDEPMRAMLAVNKTRVWVPKP